MILERFEVVCALRIGLVKASELTMRMPLAFRSRRWS